MFGDTAAKLEAETVPEDSMTRANREIPTEIRARPVRISTHLLSFPRYADELKTHMH